MQGNQTFLDPPEIQPGSEKTQGRSTERKTHAFTFDKSYWSAGDRNDPEYCSQQTLYDDLGKELLDHGFAGFNACILACEYLLNRLRTPLMVFQMARQVRTSSRNISLWYTDGSVAG